jgi:glycosyltransferase involved in cell wall biosynthesis
MDKLVKSQPLVSVVIPNYNYAIYLKQCIESVLSQTYSNLEIILVDDGSNDNSLEVARQFEDKIKIVTQTNLGVNAARNNGIKEAVGEFIAICDSDDYWVNNKIEKQMELFFKNPDLVLVYCSYFRANERSERIGEIAAAHSGYLADLFIERPTQALVAGGCSTALFKKRINQMCVFFDESLRGNGEDWDFFRRISKYGNCSYVAAPLSHIREHDRSRSGRQLRVFYEGNQAAINRALADKEYGWTHWREFIFVLKFELVMAKSYLKRGNLILALSHLVKAFLSQSLNQALKT